MILFEELAELIVLIDHFLEQVVTTHHLHTTVFGVVVKVVLLILLFVWVVRVVLKLHFRLRVHVRVVRQRVVIIWSVDEWDLWELLSSRWEHNRSHV